MPDSYFREDDVQALIDGAGGISVTCGAVTAKCLRDVADEDFLEQQSGALRGRVRSLQASTKTWASVSLAEGVAITVEGLACTVIAAYQIEDGGMMQIRVRKA